MVSSTGWGPTQTPFSHSQTRLPLLVELLLEAKQIPVSSEEALLKGINRPVTNSSLSTKVTASSEVTKVCSTTPAISKTGVLACVCVIWLHTSRGSEQFSAIASNSQTFSLFRAAMHIARKD